MKAILNSFLQLRWGPKWNRSCRTTQVYKTRFKWIGYLDNGRQPSTVSISMLKLGKLGNCGTQDGFLWFSWLVGLQSMLLHHFKTPPLSSPGWRIGLYLAMIIAIQSEFIVQYDSPNAFSRHCCSWASYQILKIAARACRERFPRHRLQRKSLFSDPVMHHGTCVTHVTWCMLGLLTRGGGENVPGMPGACATHNIVYLVRGP